MKIALSFGSGIRDVNVIHQEYELEDLEPIFSQAVFTASDSKEDKNAGRYFVPAKFKGPRNDKNLIAVSGAAKDLDNMDKGVEELIKEKLNGYVYFAYTTYNHNVKGHRWRVFIPYSQPVTPAVHKQANDWLTIQLGADKAADNLSQPAFLPRMPESRKADFQAFNTLSTGTLFNPVSVLGKAVPSQPKKIDVNTPKGDGERTDWLTHTIGTMMAAGYNDTAILEGVRAANERNEPPLSEKKLVDTLASLRRGDKQRHPNRYNDDGEPFRRYTKAELAELIDQEQDHDSLTTEIIEKIRASALKHTEEETLLKKIKEKTGTTLGALKADLKAANEEEEPSDLDYARAFLVEVNPLNVLYCEGQFLLWRNQGVWERVDDRVVSRRVIRTLEEHDLPPSITAHRVNSITDLVRTESLKEGAFFDGQKNIINLLNGELHYIGNHWHLKPHCRENYLTAQLPVKFDESANAPRFEQFLTEVFEGDTDAQDKAQALLQMMGYSLLQHCRYEKFAILIGSGANGKSVFLEVLRGLVGGSSAAVQPSQFDNKFQRGHLAGKLVNIVTEIAEGHEIKDAELKAIVSGELTTAERKFKPPFEFTPYATCWFGTNHMPHTRDFSDALFRRALILRFNNKFEGSKCDPHLKEKLLGELPGILNLAIAALTKLMTDGVFIEPQDSNEAKEQWRLEADQVAQFVEECCEKAATGFSTGTTSGELYSRYEDWARSAGIAKKVNKINFTKRLTKLGFTPRKGAKGARVIDGIKLRSYSGNWR